MRRKLLFILPLVAFVALAGFFLRGLSLNPREVPSPLIGKAAPSFERPVLHAFDRSFTPAELRGQVWLLNVWASWCAPCREEHPLFNALAQKKLVPIVGLNYKDNPEAAKKWLGALGDPYLLTVIDPDGRVGVDYGVYGVPETFVIDKGGVIRHKHIGPLTQDKLERTVLPLVQKLQQGG
jgi:cytochrome c biogenesis protein CcmG, thiol:disulfide interchange protein DsbE